MMATTHARHVKLSLEIDVLRLEVIDDLKRFHERLIAPAAAVHM